MGRKAELMEDALRRVARADDGDVVGHARLDAGPGSYDCAAAHDREQLGDGAGAYAKASPIEVGAVLVAIGPTEMPTADQNRAIGELLEREFTTSQDHHRHDEVRYTRGDHKHRCNHLQWHRLAELGGNAIGPGAGGVDDLWRLEAPSRGFDLPCAFMACQSDHRDTFQKTGAQGSCLAAKGLGGPEWIGGAVAARDDAADAAIGNGGDDELQLGAVEHLLVRETAQAQVCDAGAEAVQFVLTLGDQHLAMRLEPAIIVDDVANALPDLHGGNRQRDLGDVAGELPHATSVNPGGVSTGVVFLQHDRLDTAQREMQRGGAAMNAPADDNDIGGAGHCRTTAVKAASFCGKLANSVSEIGFTGGRSR